MQNGALKTGQEEGVKSPAKINHENMLKIGQLSAASGVRTSSIHHYLNLGLLPKPVTAGLNLHRYNQVHLAILKEIKRLREERQLPLAEIKDLLARRDWSAQPDESIAAVPLDPKAEEPAAEARWTSGIKREQLIETATELFSRLGYESVRISDITEALRMSKATFYEYFPGKEQLFIECIERLVVAVVPKEGWQAIRAEKDYFRRQRLRASQFLNSFPGYSGILQQARFFSRSENPEIAAKAKETFHIMTRPMKRDLERACAQGLIRSVDTELMAHILLGVTEAVGWKLLVDPGIDRKGALDTLNELLEFGLLPQRISNQDARLGVPPSVTVQDRQGVETTLHELHFNGLDYLEGRSGEATVKVDLVNIGDLTVDQVEAKTMTLAVRLKSGQILPLIVAAELTISGLTFFGSFSVPLVKVVRITFNRRPPAEPEVYD